MSTFDHDFIKRAGTMNWIYFAAGLGIGIAAALIWKARQEKSVGAITNKVDDAVADYDEAIRLKPDDTEAYLNRGIAKAALGRYDDAIADYDEAIHLKPDLAAAYYNRGIAKDKLGRCKDFKTALERKDFKTALERKDFKTALELARNAANANIVFRVEQSLRDLDADGG